MENKLQTLVILSTGFAANEADTACMPPQQVFVKALKKVCPGLNIVVLTFQYPFVAGEYQWYGVKVIAIGDKENGNLVRIFTWIKAWNILRRLNKQYQIIGLLSFWFGECAFVGSYFAKKHKLPHYSWLLGQDAKQGNKYFKRIKPKGDSLIALSDFIAREVKKNYGVLPVNVIPVGIDTNSFGLPPLKRDIDILGAGSLIPLKQYHLFVEVVGFLKGIFPGINAVICGKGPEMENLRCLAEKLELTENLHFLGELPHKNVLALMQRSKVFLHPSSFEGFGAVLSEALYAGAHVVSFCKPMDKDFRHHYVVKDMAEMKARIESILKNTKRGHDPVLVCPAEQIAKNMISLFVS